MNEIVRPRRLRQSDVLRHLVRETRVGVQSLIYPLFLIEGENKKREIAAMPGQYQYSPDRVVEAVDECLYAGVDKLLLFGIPAEKDEQGSGAWAEDGVVQQGLHIIRERYPEILLVSDVCLCEYTSHGHCGAICNGELDNDKTLSLLQKTALSHVEAGADVVAPSAMMDGQVKAIRSALDQNAKETSAIMSYSAKYASAFYGPFREAADSAPAFGNRKSYQMDAHNAREALKECQLDEQQGADILMVKPAWSYLDIIARVRNSTNLPLAAYSVSGEYAMVKAAAMAGMLDEYATLCEMAVSIFRAGADVLISYYAKEIANAIRKGDIG